MEVFDDVFDSLHPNNQKKSAAAQKVVQEETKLDNSPEIASIEIHRARTSPVVIPITSPVVLVAPPTGTPPPKPALVSTKSLTELLPKNTALSSVLEKLKANAAAKLKQSIEADKLSKVESNSKQQLASQEYDSNKNPTTPPPHPMGSTAPLTTSLESESKPSLATPESNQTQSALAIIEPTKPKTKSVLKPASKASAKSAGLKAVENLKN